MTLPAVPKFAPAILALSAFLGGCSTLPAAGPTGNKVINSSQTEGGRAAFVVRDLDLASANALVAASAEQPQAKAFDTLVGSVSTDLIGPGDILDIQIYEVGVSLFSGTSALTSQDSIAAAPTAHGEKFSGLTVDRNGEISLPYIGNFRVEGKTALNVGQAITQRLRSISQSPQVMVKVTENITNSVYLTGVASKPGKYDLVPGGTRLLDIIALAGGVDGAPEDLTVTLTRRGQTVEQRLGAITPGTTDDILLQPGDRILLSKRPRSFTVFGFAGRVSQIAFPANEMTLAEAIAQAAGPNDSTADATAIFLFRNIVDPTNPAAPQRVIYRLNLMEPQGYFVAQDVKMRDKDLIYVASARSNQANKFIALIGQLFSPALTARALTR